MTTHRVTFQPSGAQIQCREDQSIADAAEEQGISLFIGCDNGVCEVCRADRLSGSFRFRNTLGQSILEQDGQILCCVAHPLTNAEIYMEDVHPADHLPPRTLACQIRAVEPLGDNVWRIVLLAPAGKAVEFWPGQYLLLHAPDAAGQEEQVPYSIASAPGSLTGNDPRELELHIADHSENASRILAFLRQAVIARVTLPQGDCFISPRFLQQHSGQPLIMIAAGSGFSQIKSLVEGALAINPQQEIHLYWSNRQPGGFYASQLPLQWAQQYPNLHYHPIIEQHNPGWDGRAGWIYQVIHEDFSDLSNAQVFACGSPNMVYGTLDQLAPLGLSRANMHADVFAYAPRD